MTALRDRAAARRPSRTEDGVVRDAVPEGVGRVRPNYDVPLSCVETRGESNGRGLDLVVLAVSKLSSKNTDFRTLSSLSELTNVDVKTITPYWL